MTISKAVRAPAIAMIIYGVLSEISALFVNYAAVRMLLDPHRPPPPTNGDEQLGYYGGGAVLFVIGFISLFAAPFIVYGAVQILNGRNYPIARYAALATLLPLASCLFIVGFPIGAWAMTVLSRPDVRNSFSDDESSIRENDVP
ncbi:MAG: hypothetical protein ABI999_13935 [Acidobacteriota bacterium]